MCKRPAGESLFQDLRDLIEPRLVGLGGDGHAGELLWAITGAQPEHEPTTAEEVGGDGVFGQPDRVVEGGDRDAGAGDQPVRRTKDGGADRDHRGRITVFREVVLRDPEGVEAHLLGEASVAQHVLVQLPVSA